MAKKFLLFALALLMMGVSQAQGIQNKKVYSVRYVEQAPYGVMAWSQSPLVKNKKMRENRFVGYNSDAAKGLILDATAERNVEKNDKVAVRETAFYSVYNDKGWYVYIEAEEPLINELQDNIIDPSSPGRKELYEIFFAPGLQSVPYYQIMTYPFGEKTEFVDWGTSHRHYRSLKGSAKVESLPLKGGFGTFIFVPWDAIYEYLPLQSNHWRFSIIRWMPYGKAGGVTWGGQVHDTGNFGLVKFDQPSESQKLALEKRMLKLAWFKFQAQSKAATTFWTDDKLGDLKFYNEVLKPVIDDYSALGQSLGKPDDWNAQALSKTVGVREDWMEFDYKIGELRREYLLQKRLQNVR